MSAYLVVDRKGRPLSPSYPHLYLAISGWSPYLNFLAKERAGELEALSRYEQELADGIYLESYGQGLVA